VLVGQSVFTCSAVPILQGLLICLVLCAIYVWLVSSGPPLKITIGGS
jgi:hypothetical protein